LNGKLLLESGWILVEYPGVPRNSMAAGRACKKLYLPHRVSGIPKSQPDRCDPHRTAVVVLVKGPERVTRTGCVPLFWVSFSRAATHRFPLLLRLASVSFILSQLAS
jgi:hypothetical protein